MNVINEILDVIVIGAGQAGLACGWHLQQQNLRFLILDAERSPGGNWRNYYDSLKLFSPAAYSSLPGMRFPAEPDHYPLRDDVVRYLEDYAKAFRLPVRQYTRVQHVRRARGLFQLQTDDGEIFCSRALVVCTGVSISRSFQIFKGFRAFSGAVCTARNIEMPKALVINEWLWSVLRTRLFKLLMNWPM